ncbi:glycerol-3-phosphate dehydrogenase [Thioclava nitratireducens]|uniref:Glycerol-3-phosphate dehydrogenase n=1 Tax=Thioclava nitratireducens TaxID=1915078 RepID=A0ABM6IDT8_9RHOB|nr:glycerol-3-phosphate dehydrogenase [Thioclava nitratireducens]AQS46823.1 glycerol-3-phosphate dehydrogenase [Thioclava nitratireducens]
MPAFENNDRVTDLFVIGGGINGCGIARDAAGRGLSVTLAEMGDLAQATSSSSTKLFHGGLRYLEFFEFRLVREALREREVLLNAMPHISWPMRFVLPYSADMRFESDTPTSRLLSRIMPWMKGRRPAWLIRLGLFLYDHLGGRNLLPGTETLDLSEDEAGRPLQERFRLAYEYSDCWVQDARLVVLNARDAEARGATILTRTKVVAAERRDGVWHVTTEGREGRREHYARALVNAGGPWVENVITNTVRINTRESIRLVRGSHIVTRKLYDHDRCYFFQGEDGRICFAIPYEQDFTLIGTTDQDHQGPPGEAVCTDAEKDYLCAFVSNYFKTPVTRDDIVWTYSGVRPLYNDGASSATAATRDYVLSLDDQAGLPLLNVFGGKITTYRRLAEGALAKLAHYFPDMPGEWTARASLPGGEFAPTETDRILGEIMREYPFLDSAWAERMLRHYGLDTREILGDAKSAEDLGQDFGATLRAAEVDWLMKKEWAQTADDIVWRRTKLGLRLSASEIETLAEYTKARVADQQGAGSGMRGQA